MTLFLKFDDVGRKGFSGVVRCDLLMGGCSFYLNLGFGVCLDLGILA